MNNNNKPDLTLNMDDKIYLAVTKNTDSKFAFVFTLACLKMDKNSNSYNINATREIHTFKNKDMAEIFHDTIEQIIEKSAENKNYGVFFDNNKDLIDRFINANNNER